MAGFIAPNHRVESNRCQASRFRSRRVIGDGFCVCHGALSAAVAHSCSSEEFQSCHAHRKALVSRLWTFKAFVRLCIDNRLSRLQFD